LTFGSSEAQGLGRSGSVRSRSIGRAARSSDQSGHIARRWIGVASEVERLDAGQAAREYATNLPRNVGRRIMFRTVAACAALVAFAVFGDC
jgi:hypothetical protein